MSTTYFMGDPVTIDLSDLTIEAAVDKVRLLGTEQLVSSGDFECSPETFGFGHISDLPTVHRMVDDVTRTEWTTRWCGDNRLLTVVISLRAPPGSRLHELETITWTSEGTVDPWR